MKIAIDTSPLSSGHAGRGIGNYTRLLIDALKTYDTNNQYTNHNPDVVHYPFFDLYFLTLPLVKKKPCVVTIHDVIPLVFPNAYPPGGKGKIKFAIQKYSLSSVAHIVTDSDCSTKDVKQFLKPKPPVTTVYLAPDPAYQPASKNIINTVKEKFSLNHPYFLYVGDINYNKNLPALLKAFSSTDNHCLLVLASKALKRNNPAASHLWKVIDTLHIEPKLRIITSTDIEEMKSLYSGAAWYIQPSLYEGFGLPVLEAQACGCPVISSTGGSLREVIGDSGIIINNPSVKNLGKAIYDAMELSSARSAYIDRGYTNVKRFTWKSTVEKMVSIYESIK